MPRNRFQAILDPLGAERMQQRGRVQLPDGTWGTREQYNQARAAIRQRGQAASENARRGNPRSIRSRFWDFIGQNSEDFGSFARGAAGNAGIEGTIAETAADYALHGLDAEHEYLALLLKSIIAGGSVTATTGNPFFGLGVGASKMVKELPGLIANSLFGKKEKQDKQNSKEVRPEEPQWLIVDRKTQENSASQPQEWHVVDRETGAVPAEMSNEQQEIFITVDTKPGGRKRFDNLTMEHVDSFMLSGRRGRNERDPKRATALGDRARRRSRKFLFFTDTVL